VLLRKEPDVRICYIGDGKGDVCPCLVRLA
jgi:hypothetical protein